MQMRTIVGVIVISIVASLGAQGTGSKAPVKAGRDKAAIEKALVANENKANAAISKGDAAGFNAIVAADAWSLEATGPMPASEFGKNIAQIKLEPGWTITDTKVVWVDDNSAILIYKWSGKGTYMGQAFPSPTWSSTTYVNRGGKWVAVFHQETPAAPAGK